MLSDRLVSDADMAKFTDLRVNTTKKYFEDVPQVPGLTARPFALSRTHACF